MKLLVVDDSVVARKRITACVQELDIDTIVYATNGVDAVEKFELIKPDIVTLDMTMPQMDGMTCLGKMMEINPDANVIIISALKDKETGLDAMLKGARAYLSKPFSEEDIQVAFDKIFSKMK